ncbi:MAG: hypothetical protein OHK0048_08900 [Rhodoferax sp.]
MKKFLITLFLTLLGLGAQAQEVKAVYHLTTGIDTAMGVLGNIRNHLNADPKARIVLVANGDGVQFIVANAKDSKGREFAGVVSDLANRGVEFRICNNTLQARGIDPGKLLMEAKVVPSGVAEVAKLQSVEKFSYIKP